MASDHSVDSLHISPKTLQFVRFIRERIAEVVVVGRRQGGNQMRRGFTLVEMLVALVITLIMMAAVVTLFGVISESVSASRSAIETADRLRAARNQIQHDLQGVTATMKPPRRPENDEGYFEIIEGSRSDGINGIADTTFGNSDDHLLLFGDTDDILTFTTRSRVAPFVGRLNGTIIESPVAEVIYFLAQDPNPNSQPPLIDAASGTRLFTLYRRVLLVAPGLATAAWGMPSVASTKTYFDNNDVSVRYQGGQLFPNTLGDLTKRENRFAHYGFPPPSPPPPPWFPFEVNTPSASPPSGWQVDHQLFARYQRHRGRHRRRRHPHRD